MRTKIWMFLLLAGLPCSLLQADTLHYSVTPAGGGQNLYEFTLTNTGTTGGTLFDLFVALPIDVSDVLTSTIGTPAGWGDPSGGLLFFGPNGDPSKTFIEWTADFSGADDVQIGVPLTGFSFRTLRPITGPITFALNDSTTFDTAVLGPEAPEPAPLPMLLLGGLAITVVGAGGRWGSRRR